MPVTITDAQKFTYALQGQDAKGQPVKGALVFDAPPVWVSDTPAAATVTLNADGISGDVVGVDPGTATISVSGTIAGKDVGGQDVVTVTTGAAVKIALVAGTPSDQ